MTSYVVVIFHAQLVLLEIKILNKHWGKGQWYTVKGKKYINKPHIAKHF